MFYFLDTPFTLCADIRAKYASNPPVGIDENQSISMEGKEFPMQIGGVNLELQCPEHFGKI